MLGQAPPQYRIKDKVSELELGKHYCEITLFYGDGMGAGIADSIRSLVQ